GFAGVAFQFAGHAAVAHKSLIQHDRFDASRVGRPEEQTDRSSFGDAEERRSLTSDSVHHRTDVIHPLLETRCARQPVREAVATLVEHNNTRERRQTIQEVRVAGKLMEELDMRNNPRNKDQIPRPITNYLIGDTEIAAL